MAPGRPPPAETVDPASGPDEFEQIARLYLPLTEGSAEALGLKDDVAMLPSRPGFDLVITKDAVVEGVHFLSGEPLDLVARKLLRVNLSDLAAKGAEPHGYLLAAAWPAAVAFEARARFAAGLAQDQAAYGVRLLGGDTVSTPGPMLFSLTMLGWTPQGRLVRRDGGRAGDAVLVSGTIGDAGLGLRALTGELEALAAADREALVARHRLPSPRLELRDALRRHASAAADVSDGLLADAGHIGEASGLGVTLELDRLPLSAAASAWVAGEADPCGARLELATAGDDYEIVCAAAPEAVAPLVAAASAAGVTLSAVGTLTPGSGLCVRFEGRPVPVGRRGWTHV